MDIDQHDAPFPGARASPTKFGRSAAESLSQQPDNLAATGQNAAMQKALPTGHPAAQHMSSGGATPSTPALVSVVLMPSPIKTDDYADYKVQVTEPTASENGPPRKKRGRPKGWRAGMSYAEMRGGVAPSPVVRVGRSRQIPNYSLKRRRKTTARPDSPSPRELYLALKPAFMRFLCEWSGCQAELHNMDTLRRHIEVVHIKPRQQQHRCLWGKCGQKAGAPEMDATTFSGHLEQAHLVPMTWHVGDGPRNSWDWSTRLEMDEEHLPDFLKDEDGNQVTPSTRDQEIEDLLTYRNNRRKLKELIMRRDENMESQSDTSEGEDQAPGL